MGMTIYFTSDTHFGHTNIIRYQNRPFRDVNHMNESLIANWNERVEQDDIIYHLGDFGFGDCNHLQKVFDRLNGTKILILGNHDKETQKLIGWQSVQHYHEIWFDKQMVVLFHYAMRVWHRSHHSSILLYGHSHGSMPGNSQSLDVGVDCWKYRPITLSEIQVRLKTLPKFVGYREQAGGSDHHQPILADDGDEERHRTGFARVSTNLGKY